MALQPVDHLPRMREHVVGEARVGPPIVVVHHGREHLVHGHVVAHLLVELAAHGERARRARALSRYAGGLLEHHDRKPLFDGLERSGRAGRARADDAEVGVVGLTRLLLRRRLDEGGEARLGLRERLRARRLHGRRGERGSRHRVHEQRLLFNDGARHALHGGLEESGRVRAGQHAHVEDARFVDVDLHLHRLDDGGASEALAFDGSRLPFPVRFARVSARLHMLLDDRGIELRKVLGRGARLLDGVRDRAQHRLRREGGAGHRVHVDGLGFHDGGWQHVQGQVADILRLPVLDDLHLLDAAFRERHLHDDGAVLALACGGVRARIEADGASGGLLRGRAARKRERLGSEQSEAGEPGHSLHETPPAKLRPLFGALRRIVHDSSF